MKHKKLKVGIIGLGFMVRNVYLPILAKRKDISLEYVFDKDGKAVDEISSVYNVQKKAEIEECNLDCAFVLTPYQVRLEVIKPLLESGVDVFCEKPLSIVLKDAEKMIKLAEEKKRILMVGFNRRFMPVYQKAKEVVEKNKIKIDICRVQKQGAGLKHHSIHMIDTLRWFCGEPEQIKVFGSFKASGEDDVITSLIKFNSGAVGIFYTSSETGRRAEEMEIVGGGWSIVVNAPGWVKVFHNGKEEVYKPASQPWYMSSEELWGYVRQVDEFLSCVRKKREPLTSGKNTLGSHQLAHRIRSLCKKRGAI